MEGFHLSLSQIFKYILKVNLKTLFPSPVHNYVGMGCGRKTHRAVVSDAGGFPAPIIPAGITLVELKAVVLIPANVQQGDTKGTLAFTKEKEQPSKVASLWLLGLSEGKH